MVYKQINIVTSASAAENLPQEVTALIEIARQAAQKAYAPYSEFHVGAAILLENGEVLSGSNQENAAYPSGLCAERVTLFYANAQYPGVAVKHLVITAHNKNGYVKTPISPCGACRQVMIEKEQHQKSPMQVWLVGQATVFKIPAAINLLPLAFIPNHLTE
jgi:cytidine deaminase